MCVSNRQSLEVSYLHLSQREPMLAIWVADAPADMLGIFDDVAKKEALKLYPAYESIARDIYVRVTELPILDQIRDIRQAHLNCLIKISGVVTRRTGVFPQLQEVMYDCGRCGFVVGPIHVSGSRLGWFGFKAAAAAIHPTGPGRAPSARRRRAGR